MWDADSGMWYCHYLKRKQKILQNVQCHSLPVWLYIRASFFERYTLTKAGIPTCRPPIRDSEYMLSNRLTYILVDQNVWFLSTLNFKHSNINSLSLYFVHSHLSVIWYCYMSGRELKNKHFCAAGQFCVLGITMKICWDVHGLCIIVHRLWDCTTF